MSEQRRLQNYLQDILEAIDRMRRYVEHMDEEAFLNNRLVQDAVVRNFEIIGEASHNIRKLYPEFFVDHPGLPLAYAYQMRNALAHGYFDVNIKIVWRTIRDDLPGLDEKIRALGPDLVEGQ